MNKVVKSILIFLGVIALALVAGGIYFNATYPKVAPPTVKKISATPEMIERGRYLANHVSVCMDCHSTRDWTKYSGPPVAGTEGKGGDKFDESMGLPGTFYAKNITPHNLKNWTDGEIMRAITSGVTKHNKALFPLMPYMNYNGMSQEDLEAIVAYIRTIPAINYDVPEGSVNFPLNFIMNTFPPETSHPTKVDKSNSVSYGKYLVMIAGCQDCHTQSNEGEPVKGMEFAGGMKLKLPDYTLTTSNITPDNETGIGNWTKEVFIKTFKTYQQENYKNNKLNKGEFNTIMPWIMYSGMSEEDLGAIYDYLRTVKPVKNKVTKWTLPNAEFTTNR